ncbi:hypothetical protein P691DRAFT_110061 [Macrolepiota fuliginosa MF-IS2]|uniref:Uncharacterized protein n=1 Tax=Macrolepiota fuliginosa MF-IS2 TaxID=1400762 RepID=A0A9P5XBB4_9AGAR|nr:hypothetical protein P691DRAFT_110061 [Macrolepiota fuliginosa MF-IS2]
MCLVHGLRQPQNWQSALRHLVVDFFLRNPLRLVNYSQNFERLNLVAYESYTIHVMDGIRVPMLLPPPNASLSIPGPFSVINQGVAIIARCDYGDLIALTMNTELVQQAYSEMARLQKAADKYVG